VFVVLAFVSFSLIPPLLYTVAIRYIAVIAPIIFLVAGTGMVSMFREIWAHEGRNVILRGSFVALIALHLGVGSGLALFRQIRSPEQYNYEYNPSTLKAPYKSSGEFPPRKILIGPMLRLARATSHISWGEIKFATPYATYQALKTYCVLNSIDFVFLEHRLLKEYPFLQEFKKPVPPSEFQLLHRAQDAWGENIELFSICSSEMNYPAASCEVSKTQNRSSCRSCL